MNSSAVGGSSAEQISGERRVLIDLILEQVRKLPGTDEQRVLREAFIEHRYALELEAWRVRRNEFPRIFVAVSIGTAGLGVIARHLSPPAATVVPRLLRLCW